MKKCVLWAGVGALSLLGCTLEPTPIPECVEPLELGDEMGHPEPFGAAAAREARAARLVDATVIPQPAHGRQPIQAGDFILINDKIAVVIEDRGLSDGYGRFGGEMVSFDQVGDDGMPMGRSKFLETLVGVGLTMVNPTSVSVLADGSDGGAAIVRVTGRTEPIPFLDGSLSNLFGNFDVEVAHDYVLEPGAELVTLRVSIRNTTGELIDLGAIKYATDEIFGFFHTSQSQLATPEDGFGASSLHDWVGFVSDDWSFAWRAVDGPLEYAIEQSGFSLFGGPGMAAEACSIATSDRVQVIGGGPYYDGLREAIRRVDGEPPWRTIEGIVTDVEGNPVASAWVHELNADEMYLSRTQTDAEGRFTVHAPPDTVRLVAQRPGHSHDGVEVGASESDVTLTMAPHGTLEVNATDAAGGSLPVRVQVIPSQPLPATPEAFGVEDERDNRLHQAFVMSGAVSLVVPPGEHRVVVSRGYEWELFDTTVTVAAGETVSVDAELTRTVDSTGIMCADFHIHSFMSADSSDPIVHKVRGAIADGLEIPVSSEHEWVVDFAPVIESLGLAAWAFGMPSSELTTFKYGHFGVVPIEPLPGEYNNGAVDWLFKTPGETFALVDEKPERPALIVNHPTGSGFGAYFSSMLLSEETGEARDPNWSENFDAIEVFNDASFDGSRDEVAHWFALLNRGARFSAVGSSDSHHLRSSPVGYPRTCFPFGHDDPQRLSREDVRDAILAGSATISGGLLMTVSGPNGELPGQEVPSGSNTFTVTVEGPSWIAAEELETIVNGEVVSVEPLMPLGAGASNRYVNQVSLELERGQWVVFHARSAQDLAPLHPGRGAFAVSNPVYVAP